MSKKLIEAALFMSSRPMSAEEISKITGVTPSNVKKLLDGLQKEYGGEGKGVEIILNPEGWEMRVRPELLPKVAHLTPYSDLRDGHKRTLALIAYKEPVKQSEVVHIQGNKAYGYIKFLRKKGLIKSEKKGRTVKLMVTKEFERYFGLEKEKIKEMLRQSIEAVKGIKTDAKAETKIEVKENKAEIKAEPEPASDAEIRARPKIEEKREAAPETKIAARPAARKRKKLTPAGKIGTLRPEG